MTLEEALAEIERRDKIINSYKMLLAHERQKVSELEKEIEGFWQDQAGASI